MTNSLAVDVDGRRTARFVGDFWGRAWRPPYSARRIDGPSCNAETFDGSSSSNTCRNDARLRTIRDGVPDGPPRDSAPNFADNRGVDVWHAERKRESDAFTHTVAPGFGHALLAPVVAHIFRELHVSGAVWEHGSTWFPIYTEPSIASFEPEHAVGEERYAYNDRHLEDVLRRKTAIRGEHAGYSDLFVPILVRGQVAAILVAGPFALARPTSADVLERWRWLTGRPGHLADPEFASYLATALATLVLDGGRARAFERFLDCLARLLAGEGPADRFANEAEVLHVELAQVRLVELMGDAAREMVDERTSRRWHSSINRTALKRLGLSRMPQNVLVGLATGRAPGGDPVDEAIRRDAFQRASVELAHSLGDVIAGPVGHEGVVFLCADGGSDRRKRETLVDLAARAATLAWRRFGLSLHCGSAGAPPTIPLAQRYQAALAAAERALVEGAKLVTAKASERTSADSLRHLRHALTRAVEERPDLLDAQFARYVEAVAAQCGYRIDPIRAHLDVGFERMAEPLLHSGALDEKSFDALRDGLDRAGALARTTAELLGAYREAVSDLAQAIERPAAARHDRGLRRALEYLDQQYARPVRLAHVARLAGFTPTYFSRLFRMRQGTTFEGYLSGIRIERARQLLTSTALSVTRVAQLCGFNSPEYFSRAFRRALGSTPLEHRRQSGAAAGSDK
jgi:AraC-like DNA-binding protein